LRGKPCRGEDERVMKAGSTAAVVGEVIVVYRGAEWMATT
jgi:hypothetical protein